MINEQLQESADQAPDEAFNLVQRLMLKQSLAVSQSNKANLSMQLVFCDILRGLVNMTYGCLHIQNMQQALGA